MPTNQIHRRPAGYFLTHALRFAMALAILGGPVSSVIMAQSAAPADLMSYQGFVADANGAALASSNPVNYTVVFRIYSTSSGGSSLWAESQTVTVDKGNFSVVLGEGVAEGSEPRPTLSSVFSSATASDRYIGITVKGLSGGDPEMSPRLRLLPSPYAFLARSANGLVAADGTSLLVPESGRLRLSQAIQTTGGNTRGESAVDLQVLRQNSQPAQVASGRASSLLGGENNIASGDTAIVAGGQNNTASGLAASVLGGRNNSASGSYSTTVGGLQNTASGSYSLSAGRRANAAHQGSFVWGDSQDAEVASTGNNQFVLRASGGVAINSTPASGVALNVTGKVKSDSAEIGDLTVKNLTAENVVGSGTVPIGAIVMWSGSEASIPTGWALCDASTKNKQTTPDLRGRFIRGADGSITTGTVGGADSVTLTTKQLPSHTHQPTFSLTTAGGHSHAYNDHFFSGDSSLTGGDNKGNNNGENTWVGTGAIMDSNNPLWYRSMATASAGDHTHGFSLTIASTGDGQSFSIMPKYYALAFIMRVQ